MTGDYHYWVFGSGKIMPPLLQGLDDSKEFPIINVIVSLSGREGGRVISAGMEISIGVLLHEYSSRGSKGGIHHDKEGFSGICCTHSTCHGILFPFSLHSTLCRFSPDHLRCTVQARLCRKCCRHIISLGPYCLSMTSYSMPWRLCVAVLIMISSSFAIRRR